VPPPASGTAAAPGGPRRNVFARLDRNGDGAIDQSEWQKFQQFRFRRLDTDENGSLSASEMEQGGRRPAGGGRAGQPARLARLDANGNGTITQQEFLAGQMAMLTRLDADENGSVSKAEFARVTGALAGGQQSQPPPDLDDMQ
jgi:Ca2+-binding EF-hand superfamily protein